MIEANLPTDWRQLQTAVARILRECGLRAQVEQTLNTARGCVIVDVVGTDDAQNPPSVYLFECKLWRKRVPKTTIHALRAVVNDSGANWGVIVSGAGFQSGARDAAGHSNVLCRTWDEFQKDWESRWVENYFNPTLYAAASPLLEYTEPINSRIFRKADALPQEQRDEFIRLRKKHFALAFIATAQSIPDYPGLPLGTTIERTPDLPIRTRLAAYSDELEMPDDILLDAEARRPFLEAFVRYVQNSTAEFDRIFGERA